jgi:hypothetical protein
MGVCKGTNFAKHVENPRIQIKIKLNKTKTPSIDGVFVLLKIFVIEHSFVV